MKKISAVLVCLFISACGGGGGSSAPAGSVAPTTFPILQAYKALSASGYNSNFTATLSGPTVSVACSGSGNIAVAPAITSTTFNITPTNTVSALSAVQTFTLNWTNCTPASSVTTATSYYNPSNYLSLGDNNTGVNYGVYLTPPTWPAAVTVGATGIYGTENLYTDSTETTSNGHRDNSYVVTADTASTAIFTAISKAYNASGTLLYTEQDAWKITTAGAVTPVSVTVSYSSGANSGDTLTLTYN